MEEVVRWYVWVYEMVGIRKKEDQVMCEFRVISVVSSIESFVMCVSYIFPTWILCCRPYVGPMQAL